MPDILTAETPAGRLRGEVRGPLSIFRNIPYAQAGRFRPPEPPVAWSGERDAVRRGPICPQNPSRFAFAVNDPGPRLVRSEDCLVLTVTTPGMAGRRPVIVWLHGGAYLVGGGEMGEYDADRLALECGVVVVSVTYRLGLFGYLWDDDPARRNLGLQDQLAALDWVAAHIERFGGDPDNITAVGQSAGGHSIVTMLQVRAGALPFHRAILQSAPVAARLTPEAAKRLAVAFHDALGQDADGADATAMLAAQAKALIAQGPSGMPLGPVMEAGVSTREELDVLAGWARDDAATLVAMSTGLSRHSIWYGDEGGGPLTAKVTRDVFEGPVTAFAAATPRGAKTYLYRLDLRPTDSPFGACHCMDLPLLFGSESDWRGAGMLGGEHWSRFADLGARVRAAWGAFARTGDPATNSEWDWSPWSGAVAGGVTNLAG
jgi:para-nitrobenzyl esterase